MCLIFQQYFGRITDCTDNKSVDFSLDRHAKHQYANNGPVGSSSITRTLTWQIVEVSTIFKFKFSGPVIFCLVFRRRPNSEITLAWCNHTFWGQETSCKNFKTKLCHVVYTYASTFEIRQTCREMQRYDRTGKQAQHNPNAQKG